MAEVRSLLALVEQADHKSEAAYVDIPAELSRLKVRLVAIFCPITSRVKGYPFEVALPESLSVSGVALADQVKSLDWRRRNADFADCVPDATI